MPKNVTYKDLYLLTREEIMDALRYISTNQYGAQTERVSVFSDSLAPQSGGLYRALKDIIDTVNEVKDFLSEGVENRIIEGLDVKAEEPISNKVEIWKGSGIAGGEIHTLVNTQTLTIPFDDTTSVFYVNLFKGRIQIERAEHSDKLTVAKIVVPNPGTTSQVRDKSDGGYDAYIQMFKEYKLYGYDDQFEEDTIEMLRNNIGEVLADNLIGNIKLSENMKIINTAGTFEANSSELKFYDTDENLLSKFDTRGTFFYDTDGKEMARFTSDDAKIGNILITPTTIQSEDFATGYLGAGFQITDEGNAEFNNILARGMLRCSVFQKDTISVVGGNLLVMDGDLLDEDMTALDSSTLTIKGETTFAVGDILRIKDGFDDEWMEVTDVASGGTVYTVTRDKASSYDADDNPTWKKGTSVVNFGASGEGGIYMTSSEPNAPYLSIVTHAGAPWSTLTTHLKLGNLNGFLGYTTDKYGIAIGSTNSYLKYDPTNDLRVKGKITITDSESASELAPTSAGLYLTSDYLGYYDGTDPYNASGWDVYIKSDGTFYFGGDGTNYVEWDGAALTVRGTLNAGDLALGTLDCGLVTISSDDGKMTLTGNVLTVKDGSDVDQVKLGKYDASNYGLWAGAGDVIVNDDGIEINDGGDVSSSKLLMKDKSSISFFDVDGAIARMWGEKTGPQHELVIDSPPSFKAFCRAKFEIPILVNDGIQADHIYALEYYRGEERSSDPTEPDEGEYVIWMTDGSGSMGDDGDVLVASKAGGTTKYTIIHDHSAGTNWGS